MSRTTPEVRRPVRVASPFSPLPPATVATVATTGREGVASSCFDSQMRITKKTAKCLQSVSTVATVDFKFTCQGGLHGQN